MARRWYALAVLAALGPSTSGCFMYCPMYATSGCLEVSEIHALAQAGDPGRLLGLLDDERSWVREEAARAAGEGRITDTTRRLEQMLADGQEPSWVRAAAAGALGRIADPTSRPILAGTAAASGVDPELKLAVIDALCADPAGRAEALQAIQPLGQDDDLLVAAYAEKKVRSQCAR